MLLLCRSPGASLPRLWSRVVRTGAIRSSWEMPALTSLGSRSGNNVHRTSSGTVLVLGQYEAEEDNDVSHRIAALGGQSVVAMRLVASPIAHPIAHPTSPTTIGRVCRHVTPLCDVIPYDRAQPMLQVASFRGGRGVSGPTYSSYIQYLPVHTVHAAQYHYPLTGSS